MYIYIYNTCQHHSTRTLWKRKLVTSAICHVQIFRSRCQRNAPGSMFRCTFWWTFWWTVEDYAALSSVDCFGGIQAPTHSCQPQQHALHMSHSGWVCPEFLKSEWEPVTNHLNHRNLLITPRSLPQTGPNVGHLGCSAGAFPRFPAVRTSIMCQKQGSQTMQTWAWDTHSSNLSVVLSAMEGLSF